MRWRPAGAVVLGAALMATVAGWYRVDLRGCTNFPGPGTALVATPLYLLALGLQSWGWLRLARLAEHGRARLAVVLLVGALAQCIIVLSPPAFSVDPLLYGAIGRALGEAGADPTAALGVSLPADDPFRALLPGQERWFARGSAYGPGFNWLMGALAGLYGADVTAALRLLQGVALGAVGLGLGLLLASSRGEQERGATAAWVLLCPLLCMEASLGAHNDALLFACVAAFVLAWRAGRVWLAAAALALGLLVKATAALLLVWYLLVLALQWWARPRGGRQAAGLALAGLAGLGLLLAALALPLIERHAWVAFTLLDDRAEPFPSCTRSLECLPRAMLHLGLGAPTAAWIVGLCFRGLATLWLVFSARRAAADGQVLAWAGSFLLVYFLVLNGYNQPWYLLSLLPLLPFAHPSSRAAMCALLISSELDYALHPLLECDARPAARLAREVLGGLALLGPPLLLLISDWGPNLIQAWPRSHRRSGERDPS